LSDRTSPSSTSNSSQPIHIPLLSPVEVGRGVEPAQAGAPAAEPVAGVIRVREPAPGRVQAWASVRVPVAGPVLVAGRVPVAGREPGSAADSVAAQSQTVSCPGPTAFPQFAVITASHPERA
jgi:hypothetical protein